MNVMESSNRRLTLFEQMSAVDNGRSALAGLTLDAVLGNPKRSQPPPTHNRTLLDIIRDDGHTKDKKTWKTFRDKLRLKRAGAAWTSSVPIPASDVNDYSNRSQRRTTFRLDDGGGSDPPVPNSRMQLARRTSVRLGPNQAHSDRDDSVDATMPSDGPPSRSFRPQFARHQSTRAPSDDDDNSDSDSPGARRLGTALAEERQLSAREAVAAQEAAEAAAAEQAAAEAAAGEENSPPAEEPVRMSLMDLLEETDRQMGLSGSRYTMGDDDDDEYYDEDEDDEEEEEEEEEAVSGGGIEYTCCVCMVRHKGAAFIPCGHTFCRLCSRELWVQRGNCPLCNGFILEILDIF
ncbi:Zinc finger, RING/FYVE/PHD-type [Corchorus olitorius]|uniref:Zinc finger, RING/FYVE/PHD-type n=1 Tax=Corchorus olitorius TaxID=93759 RepID=A0A1R3JLW0_9ROSI|nr:Zinc finger, RING/FYVE/PHD-type [Corchorus olitorius]